MKALAAIVAALSVGLGARAAAADPDQSMQFAGSIVLGHAPEGLGPVALVASGWGMSFRDSRVDVSQGIASLGVRGWFLPSVWMQWGVGAAAGESSREATVIDMRQPLEPAAMLGVGGDLIATDDVVVQLAMHGGTALDEAGRPSVYHVSLGLDLAWR